MGNEGTEKREWTPNVVQNVLGGDLNSQEMLEFGPLSTATVLPL